jgi:hypothetical protein
MIWKNYSLKKEINFIVKWQVKQNDLEDSESTDDNIKNDNTINGSSLDNDNHNSRFNR